MFHNIGQWYLYLTMNLDNSVLIKWAWLELINVHKDMIDSLIESVEIAVYQVIQVYYHLL